VNFPEGGETPSNYIALGIIGGKVLADMGVDCSIWAAGVFKITERLPG